MNRHSRSVAAVALAIVLSLQLAPVAVASPRDRDDFTAKIVRFLHKVQRFVGLTPFDEGIIPPLPK